jgi:type I restriction enzyme M protein
VADAKTPLERWARSRELANTIEAEHPFERFEELLQIALEVARPRRILLMLDEFEKIHEGIEQHTLSPLVPENFRYLFHTYPELSGILSGSRRIKRLRQEYWNVLFGIGKPIWVRSLNADAARQLIIRPVAGRLRYSDSAVDSAIALCACQPLLLQSLASAVFDTCVKSRQTSVTLAIVEEAAQSLVQKIEHFPTIYRQEALTPRRRFLTCLINKLTPGPDRVTFDLLLDQSEAFGVEYPSEGELKEDLEELQELELIRFDASSASYQIEIPLFSHWLDRLDFQAELGKAKS